MLCSSIRKGLLSHKAMRVAAPRAFASSYRPQLHPKRLNAKVLKADYAVRGLLVLMAEEMQTKLKEPNHGLPFDEIIFCNIGNPQSVGQQPLTFPRQVMSLCMNRDLLSEKNLPHTSKIFPEDAIARAQRALSNTNSFGAYSHSMGLPWLRDSVVNFIEARDGGVKSSPDKIFLTNGASDGVTRVLNLLVRDSRDGIMIPIPQYPLYSATLSLLDGTAVEYFLDEKKNWGCSLGELERAYAQAEEKGVSTRAMCVINPGNPTGQVLSLANMQDIIKFCHSKGLCLMADEVYQANIYGEKPFYSFKKVLADMGEAYQGLELFSFHSTSKGFLGECGFRGGYMECHNVDPEVQDQIYKLVSIGLCSNLPGQLMTELMVNPPTEGDASYELYNQEKNEIVTSLGRRAKKCAAAFNSMEGMSCNDAEGAMYLFPKITLPEGVLAAAREKNLPADTFYAVELLNNTGICVVPGTGFGQVEGTFHFRTTFLPPEDKMDSVIEKMSTFHAKFMAQYK